MEVWKVGIGDHLGGGACEPLGVVQIAAPRGDPRPDTSAESLRNEVVVGGELLRDVDETGRLFVAAPAGERLRKVGGDDCPRLPSRPSVPRSRSPSAARARPPRRPRRVPRCRLRWCSALPAGRSGQAPRSARSQSSRDSRAFLAKLAAHRTHGPASALPEVARLARAGGLPAGLPRKKLALAVGAICLVRPDVGTASRAPSRARPTSAASSRGSTASRACSKALSTASTRAPHRPRSTASSPVSLHARAQTEVVAGLLEDGDRARGYFRRRSSSRPPPAKISEELALDLRPRLESAVTHRPEPCVALRSMTSPARVEVSDRS